ncbi:unnamed protein product [Moneuplotes crassus]|uniref:Uncharacterized protein n=1 Tax=Euplotes crassus TaxID=5936 RepID=A0AAD1U327_EUPCR|nr:unnamed protein product [Moneuplotes crassus]
MELNQVNKKKKCRGLNCQRIRKYYCNDHKEQLCLECCSAVHYQCCKTRIEEPEELDHVMRLLFNYIKSLKKKANDFGLLEKIQGLEVALEEISQDFTTYQEAATKAIRNDAFLEYGEILEAFQKMQSEILHGKYKNGINGCNPISKLLQDSELHFISNGGEYISKEKIKSTYEYTSAIREISKRNKQIMEQKKNEELKKMEEEIEEKYKLQFESVITDLQSKLTAQEASLSEEQKAKDTLQTSNAALSSQVEDLTAENAKIAEELKENLALVEQHEEVICKVGKPACKEVYKRVMGADVSFDEGYVVNLDMKQEKAKKVVKEFADLKLILPKIKGIRLECIKECEESLIYEFVKYCCPSSIPCLCINRYNNGLIPQDSKIIKEINTVLQNVTDEVCINHFSISSEDISDVFRNSWNSKTLMLRVCKLNTKDDMNFENEQHQSKIEKLDFSWGGSSELNSDPNNFEEMFTHIISAISKSSIKTSLKSINIGLNSISTSKMTSLLTSHSMSHIQILSSNNDPQI